MKTNTRNICIWLFVTLSFISCGQNNNQREQTFVQELNKMLAWPEAGVYSDVGIPEQGRPVIPA